MLVGKEDKMMNEEQHEAYNVQNFFIFKTSWGFYRMPVDQASIMH